MKITGPHRTYTPAEARELGIPVHPEAVSVRVYGVVSPVVQISPETWDKQYRDGVWERLKGYTAHYAVVGAMVRKYGARSVVDMGAGEGLLRGFLYGDLAYAGYDVSPEVIRKSVLISGPVDASNFTPGPEVDCVVFCESLYYMNEPLELLGRYLKSAKFAVVSIFDSDKTKQLIFGLLDNFKVLEDVHITSGDSGWRVMVLQ